MKNLKFNIEVVAKIEDCLFKIIVEKLSILEK